MKNRKIKPKKESALVEIFDSRTGLNKELLKYPAFRKAMEKVIKINDEYEKRKPKISPDNK